MGYILEAEWIDLADVVGVRDEEKRENVGDF